MLYAKETILYKRRADLEIRGIENIWIELINNHKRINFGIFFIDLQILILITFQIFKIL